MSQYYMLTCEVNISYDDLYVPVKPFDTQTTFDF